MNIHIAVIKNLGREESGINGHTIKQYDDYTDSYIYVYLEMILVKLYWKHP